MRIKYILLIGCFLTQNLFAYGVYNHTSKKLKVKGERCASCFEKTIKSKKNKACNECGSRYISILWNDYNPYGNEYNQPPICFDVGKATYGANGDYYYYFPKKVPKHGWVSIYEDSHGEFKWLKGTVKNKHGKIIWNGPLKIQCEPR